jgi:hypothetical protein
MHIVTGIGILGGRGRRLEGNLMRREMQLNVGSVGLLFLIISLRRSVIPQKRSPFHHFLASCTSRNPDRFNSRNHSAMPNWLPSIVHV